MTNQQLLAISKEQLDQVIEALETARDYSGDTVRNINSALTTLRGLPDLEEVGEAWEEDVADGIGSFTPRWFVDTPDETRKAILLYAIKEEE